MGVTEARGEIAEMVQGEPYELIESNIWISYEFKRHES
jgi:hypothetical protein